MEEFPDVFTSVSETSGDTETSVKVDATILADSEESKTDPMFVVANFARELQKAFATENETAFHKANFAVMEALRSPDLTRDVKDDIYNTVAVMYSKAQAEVEEKAQTATRHKLDRIKEIALGVVFVCVLPYAMAKNMALLATVSLIGLFLLLAPRLGFRLLNAARKIEELEEPTRESRNGDSER